MSGANYKCDLCGLSCSIVPGSPPWIQHQCSGASQSALPTEAAVPEMVWVDLDKDGRPVGIYEYDPTGIRNDFTVPYVLRSDLLKQVRQTRAEAFDEAAQFLDNEIDRCWGLMDRCARRFRDKAKQAREEGK